MTEINLDDINIYELLIPGKNQKKVSFNENEIIIPEVIEDSEKNKKNKSSIKYFIIIIILLLVGGGTYLYYNTFLLNNKTPKLNIENILTYDTRIIVR